MFLPVKHKLQSSHFFVSAVEMVSKCLLLCVARRRGRSLQAWLCPGPGCLQSPAQPAAVCSTQCSQHPGPQTAVVCSSSVQGGGSSVSQSSTDKNVPFYHHHRVPAVSAAPASSNPRPRCISAPEFGDLTHKNHPQPGPAADHLHSPKDHRWLKLRPLCL